MKNIGFDQSTVMTEFAKLMQKTEITKTAENKNLVELKNKLLNSQYKDLLNKARIGNAKEPAVMVYNIEEEYKDIITDKVNLPADLNTILDPYRAKSGSLKRTAKSDSKVYDVSGETGRDLIDSAHPGNMKTELTSKTDENLVETVFEQQEADIAAINKVPKGTYAKLMNLHKKLSAMGVKDLADLEADIKKIATENDVVLYTLSELANELDARGEIEAANKIDELIKNAADPVDMKIGPITMEEAKLSPTRVLSEAEKKVELEKDISVLKPSIEKLNKVIVNKFVDTVIATISAKGASEALRSLFTSHLEKIKSAPNYTAAKIGVKNIIKGQPWEDEVVGAGEKAVEAEVKQIDEYKTKLDISEKALAVLMKPLEQPGEATVIRKDKKSSVSNKSISKRSEVWTQQDSDKMGQEVAKELEKSVPQKRELSPQQKVQALQKWYNKTMNEKILREDGFIDDPTRAQIGLFKQMGWKRYADSVKNFSVKYQESKKLSPEVAKQQARELGQDAAKAVGEIITK